MSPPCTAVSVTDDTGTTVVIPSPPQRIVSLAPSNTEILYALGLGDRVVGVTDYCNFPPEAKGKQKVGGYSTVSIEKVVALRPDLVVAAYGNGKDVVESIRSLGIPVVSLHPLTLDDVLKDIELIGLATGAKENARVVTGDLRRRIDAIEVRTRGAEYRPRVAHVIWNNPIYVSGNGTLQDKLIRLAGGRNAFAHLEGWKNVGIEDFISADPEVLVVNTGTGMGGGGDAIARYFREEPRFAGVSAIRNGRVFLVDSDIVDRAGPRVVEALELFASGISSVDEEQDARGDPASEATRTLSLPFLAPVCALVAIAAISLRMGSGRGNRE
ncbi:MAG: cobalamin-binding protein [Methanolinea sp.]|nr:cobalamin-binding protein [Methanolinea sp.]